MIADGPEGGKSRRSNRTGKAGLFWRASRLQGQLIIPYVLLTLLLAIIGIFITTRLVTSTFRERFINQLYETTRSAADAVVRQENANLDHLRLAMFTDGMAPAVDRRDAGTIEALIAPLVYNYNIDTISLLDPEGIELLTLARDPASNNYVRSWGGDFSAYEFVRLALSGTSDDAGDKYVGLVNVPGGPTLFTAAPIYNANGRGVVGGILIGARLSRLLGEMSSQGLSPANIVILNEDYNILITSLAEPEEGFGSIETVARQQAGDPVTRVHPLRLYGRPYQIIFTELLIRSQRLGWLGVLLPSDYVVATETTSRNAFIMIFTAGTLAVILIGYLLAQSIAEPILKLRALTQAVSAGNLNQESGLKRSDEIGELADAFDLMTLRLRERTVEAAQLYDEAIQRNRELAETNARLRSTQQQLIQSEKLAAIGQLTAGIVHDVKNPLTVIKGVAELLLIEEDLPGEMSSEIGLIRDSAIKANRIVSDLLKFARQSQPEMGLHDLRETVETALRLTAFPIRKAHVQVTKDLPETALMMTYDDQQIEQVLVNIISNAVQAMPTGGKLHIHLNRVNGVAAVAIQDSGIGILPEHLNRIFDPFFTTKPEADGTGLGLSVSHGIISNHNGRIEVESKIDQGSTFTILLPVRLPEEELVPA